MSDETTAPKKPLAKVFQKSVSPYSKALSLHPHLYEGELYKRASELLALDRLVNHLRLVAEEAKHKEYRRLTPTLEAIKDALNGNPKLSWWNLVTISIGRAFSQEEDDEERNTREKEFLTQISEMLTEIIRTFQSTNTKLLLEIRLTALEVDSRLIELDQIPGSTKESNETLEYLSSEFNLLCRELDTVAAAPPDTWNKNLGNFVSLIKKINQLMQIVAGLATSNPYAYKQFSKKELVQSLEAKTTFLVTHTHLVPANQQLDFWDIPKLNEFFTLFGFFPAIAGSLSFVDFATLLMHLEQLFISDPSPGKTPPEALSSPLLREIILQKNDEGAKWTEQVRAAVKAKNERSISKDLAAFFKARLMGENDLHSLCGMIRYKSQDFAPPAKTPPNIQKECLMRMRLLAQSAQPKDLDAVLKTFTTEEMATRYYLLQEVILEQFIFWRKNGIF